MQERGRGAISYDLFCSCYVGAFPVGLSDVPEDVSGFRRKNFCNLPFKSMVLVNTVFHYC